MVKITNLIYHEGVRKYFKNTSWMFAERLLRIFAGLFIGIWVARYLGPEEFGVFSYVLAFIAIFGGVAKLGLDDIVVRELINNPEKRNIYLGTAFWLKIIGAVIAFCLIAAILPFTSNDSSTNFFILIITAGLLFQSFEVVEFYFLSEVKAKIISICKVIQLSISSLLKIYLVLTEAELFWFILVTASDALSLALSYFIAYRFNQKTGFYKYFDFSIAKEMLKDSWPIIFSAIVIMIYMRIDQIMIKEMLGDHEVGIYSAAVKLSEGFYFISVLITASLFPAILNAKKQSDALYKLRLQRLYTFMVWAAIFIAIPITILSDWLIILLFGNAYQEAGQVLMVHAWAAIFVFLGMAFSKYLLAENLTKIAFYRTLTGAISNVLLNLWLIPTHGLIGAALATLLAQFIANFGYDFLDNRLYKQLVMKIKALTMPWLIFR